MFWLKLQKHFMPVKLEISVRHQNNLRKFHGPILSCVPNTVQSVYVLDQQLNFLSRRKFQVAIAGLQDQPNLRAVVVRLPGLFSLAK